MLSRNLQKLVYYKQFINYILASVAGYVLVFASLYFCVEILSLDPRVSFFVTYLWIYVLSFFMQRAIFSSEEYKKAVPRFIGHILFFLLIGNSLFNLLYYLGLNYIESTIGVIVLIFPFRFLSSKYLVFRD